MIYRDFLNCGYKIFGLHPIVDDHCACGNARCHAAGKHPLASSWQHTPVYSDEQVSAGEEAGQFASGYGVLCDGLLVIDIDARNGGNESYLKLIDKVNEVVGAGLIVATGSGNGSKHLYFSISRDTRLKTFLSEYPGIDFKSSGYVVGPGSAHVSGGTYSVLVGSPFDIAEAPRNLINMLSTPVAVPTAIQRRGASKVNNDDIDYMLRYIDPDANYDMWIRCGMAIHDETNAQGVELWRNWTARYKDETHAHRMSSIDQRWKSFGRSDARTTVGTLIHYAEMGGWVSSVEFTPDVEYDVPDDFVAAENNVNLLKPPGFVGEVAAWIESQSRRPRESVSVAAALVSVGNIIGLNYVDDKDAVTSNLFAFCVAGSRTGKESAQQAIHDIMTEASLSAATHGHIKSEQEIIRNIAIRHQASFYVIDEVGILLQKIQSAQQKGGAIYLDGVIGTLMSAYGKANGKMLISGDLKETIRSDLTRMIAAARKQKESEFSDEDSEDNEITKSLLDRLATIDDGIRKPFLSLLGFTTPVTFDGLVDFTSATNGFIGRSLIFKEQDTAPRSKPKFKKLAMPEKMARTIRRLAATGVCDKIGRRVENTSERAQIQTDPAGVVALDEALDWFESQAEYHKEKTGLEALYLGAYELVSKVSLILSAATGSRTVEHVEWATALVKADIEHKARMVEITDNENSDKQRALKSAVANIVTGGWETKGVIVNRLRKKYKKEDVEKMIDLLVDHKILIVDEKEFGCGGRFTYKYKLIQ